MLNQFDFFPKLHDELKVKTLSGGAVSIVSGLCILVLLFSELIRFISVQKTEHVCVDTTRDQELHINFDITMHRLPCTLVSIDARDTFGDHQTNVLHHVHKHRIDLDGKPIGDAPVKVQMKQTMHTDDLKALATRNKDPEEVKEKKKEIDEKEKDKCLSCYGASTQPGQCCNTCVELRSAYTARGWSLNSLKDTTQCKDQPLTPRFEQLENHEGCRLTGYLNVSKVAGNFHISPGKTHEVNSVHVYDLGAFRDGQFNISHDIHTLSFGDHYPVGRISE